MAQDPPPDDLEIAGSEILLRRIHPNDLVSNQVGDPLISSAAFDDLPGPDGAMSVIVESILLANRGSEADVLEGLPNHGLAAFPVQLARALGFGVVLSPGAGPDPVELAHAEVYCKKDDKRRRRLRDGSEIRRWPTNPESG